MPKTAPAREPNNPTSMTADAEASYKSLRSVMGEVSSSGAMFASYPGLLSPALSRGARADAARSRLPHRAPSAAGLGYSAPRFKPYPHGVLPPLGSRLPPRSPQELSGHHDGIANAPQQR